MHAVYRSRLIARCGARIVTKMQRIANKAPYQTHQAVTKQVISPCRDASSKCCPLAPKVMNTGAKAPVFIYVIFRLLPQRRENRG